MEWKSHRIAHYCFSGVSRDISPVSDVLIEDVFRAQHRRGGEAVIASSPFNNKRCKR
jgi:hypothetical protein